MLTSVESPLSNKEQFERLLERMRRDWNERATQDGEHYVYTRDSNSDEGDFEASGRVNYDQLVRPYLPVLLNGRSPSCSRVAEIGCGLGRITRSFAEEFLEVHGIDVSPRMIEQARSRLRDYPNVILHVGSGQDLGSLPGNYFDLAFSYLVFQHIPSREVVENYIREAARVLKPEGAFRFQLQDTCRLSTGGRRRTPGWGKVFLWPRPPRCWPLPGFRR